MYIKQSQKLIECSLLILFALVLAGRTASAQKIDQISDRIAIAEQIARYSYTGDAKDLKGFLALFTPDAIWQIIPAGQTEPNICLKSREEIRDFSADLYKRNAGIQTGHHQSGLLFTELTKDTARTQIMLLVTRKGPNDSAPRVEMSGVYYDTWRKTAQGWLITSRTLRMDPLHLSSK